MVLIQFSEMKLDPPLNQDVLEHIFTISGNRHGFKVIIFLIKNVLACN